MNKKKTIPIAVLAVVLLLLLAFAVLWVITRPDAPVLPFGDETVPWETADETESREIKFETARFSVPSDWKVRDETGGLILTPPGAGESGVRLEYYPDNSFGVCGTGLEEETFTLPCGAEANAGYYDGSKNWSFLCADNGYVMLNEGLAGELAERAKEVFFNMRMQPSETKEYTVSELSPELAWVGWSEDGFTAMMSLSVKNRYYPMSSRQGLPTAVITSKTELEAFRKKAGEHFQLDTFYSNENGKFMSFSDITEKCDEKFFEKNALLVTLIEESTGSASHALENAALYENGLEMYIKTDVPEVYTCDMAGWFLCTVFPLEDVSGLEYVNAWK